MSTVSKLIVGSFEMSVPHLRGRHSLDQCTAAIAQREQPSCSDDYECHSAPKLHGP